VSGYAGIKVGSFVAPLTASTANSLLDDADPALSAVLAFCQGVLPIHLGARFDAEVVRAGRPDLAGHLADRAIPYDPLPFLAQEQLVPPLLAVYPIRENTHEKTRNWWHLEEQWRVQWILPPLTPAQFLQLSPILRAVGRVLVDRIEQGWDPAYKTGSKVFSVANIEEIGVTECRYGTVAGIDSKIFFPAVEIDLLVSEQKGPTPGNEALDGIDAKVQSTNSDGSNPVDVNGASL